jgi:DNA polymerase iota
VTDIIDYNLGLVNQHSLGNSYFQLSQKDPACGFTCDYSALPGCIEGSTPTIVDRETTGYLRLMLGSHLARYLRLRLEEDFGYTSTCGISTNKVLSKLVGAKNKPRNQTTLLALRDDDVQNFMDRHTLRNVPGIGFKTASVLEMHVTGVESSTDSHEFVSTVTVGQVRSHASITPGSLQRLLAGPGAEKGVGLRIWALLHGVDTTEVKEAGDIPSQISIEDTFKGLESLPQITEQLYALSCSLIRRMRVDLLVLDENADPPGSFKWLARPKTLRLSIRSWPRSGLRSDRSFSRTSRSGLVPNFVFDYSLDIEAIADRLLSECLLPLLRRLQSEAGQPWNLQLINICVANMVPGAAETGAGVGRDIANMLRKQEEVLAPWRITSNEANNNNGESEESEFEDIEAADGWGTTEHTRCPQCGHSIPHFALTAHLRYHEMEE